jgi:uncharacterized protein YndB with AHSA1/START domain
VARRSGEFVLDLERVLPAPRPAVFAAFTEPNELTRRWGPEGFAIRSVDFTARVGERYRIEMQPPAGDAFHLSGELREVEPPARLAYTFVWEPPDPDDVQTLVTLSFRDLGESTRVSLVQRAFKTAARRALHRDGWSESLDKLERLLYARDGTSTKSSHSA